MGFSTYFFENNYRKQCLGWVMGGYRGGTEHWMKASSESPILRNSQADSSVQQTGSWGAWGVLYRWDNGQFPNKADGKDYSQKTGCPDATADSYL